MMQSTSSDFSDNTYESVVDMGCWLVAVHIRIGPQYHVVRSDAVYTNKVEFLACSYPGQIGPQYILTVRPGAVCTNKLNSLSLMLRTVLPM
jgi:hypothetical protein